MYIKNNTGRILTHQRPQVPKITTSPPVTHHVLEDILGKPSVRKALLWMTRRGSDGKCFFEKTCENYDNRTADFWTRAKWKAPTIAINLGLARAGLDRELLKKKLFQHIPTVKALALTAKSVGTHGLTVPQRFAAPLITVWNITQACNLTCKHCYQNAKHKPLADELTTEEKLDLLDQLADEYVPFTAFAGGEPLIARDLWQVLEKCRERQIHVTVATNGTLLTPEMCARLKEAGVMYLEVSIDSIDPAQHDEFRGLPGAWARSVQGIKHSVAAGIRTGLATCFTRETVDSADEVVQFAIDLGCETFSHFNFIPVGRGKEMIGEDLTPGQRELLIRKLTRHLQEGKISVISTAPQFGRSCIVYGSADGIFATGHAGKGEGKKTMVLSRYIGGCGAGRCYCAIQPNGAINPCVYIPTIEVGNIRQRKFKDIWNNPLFDTLADRDDRGDHCGVCDYRLYCGGCRARSLLYTNDIQAGDPGCVFNLHEWDELMASGPADAVFEHGNGKNGTAPDTGSETLDLAPLVMLVSSRAASAAARSGALEDVTRTELDELELAESEAQPWLDRK